MTPESNEPTTPKAVGCSAWLGHPIASWLRNKLGLYRSRPFLQLMLRVSNLALKYQQVLYMAIKRRENIGLMEYHFVKFRYRCLFFVHNVMLAGLTDGTQRPGPSEDKPETDAPKPGSLE